jgi:hypothetical protein
VRDGNDVKFVRLTIDFSLLQIWLYEQSIALVSKLGGVTDLEVSQRHHLLQQGYVC